MSKPIVVNVKDNPTVPYIYCGRGRGSKWGNPYVIGKRWGSKIIDRELAIELYKGYIEKEIANNPNMDIEELRGHNLGCWCAPQPCHCDYLLEKANRND